MRVQRVWGAESQIEMQTAKWAVEGMVKGVKAEYSMTWRHTLVARDMFVSR